MKLPQYIFLDGEYVEYQDAKIHVLSTANKFAAVVYEGIRGYWNEEQQELYIFRHKEHLQRLFRSMKICRMESPYNYEQYKEILIKLIKKCNLREDIHIRQQSLVLADNGGIASTGPIGVMIAAVPMGRYFGSEKKGINVCVSSWTRISDIALPPRIKCTGNYANSRLSSIQAKEDGYDEAILLTYQGYVSEGSVANLFIIIDGRPITPLATDGILEGITRATIIELFKTEHNLDVVERHIERTELYTAEEAFFCGSGAEITPIHSIDRHKLVNTREQSLTQAIRDTYSRVVTGQNSAYFNWLTPVYKAE